MSDTTYDRRAFMAYFGSIGLGSTLMPGVLWAHVQQQPAVAGDHQGNDRVGRGDLRAVVLRRGAHERWLRDLRQMRDGIQQLHKEPLDQSMLPAIVFDPVPPGKELPKKTKAMTVRSKVPVMARPGSLEELAYAPVTELSELVRKRAR